SLTRNDAYDWAPESAAHQGPAYLDGVTYRFIPEISTRTQALSSGQVDIIDSVQSYDVELFADDPNYTHIVGYDTTTAFGLNLNAGLFPTDDIRVREALRDGFDLDAIVKSLYLGV